MDISYPYICSARDDIPEEAIEQLDTQIVENIGGAFSQIFPQFCDKFRLASANLDEFWDTPKLVLEKGMHEWLPFVVAQTENKNLFFCLQPEFIEKEGKDFDENHQMLPEGWKELYRWFNSFVITDQSYWPGDWVNTPFRYEARKDLDDYKDMVGVTRKQTNQFAKELDCKREVLRCWLFTENEDALFINEEACDGRVYHVQGKKLEIITEISHPTETLDRYLAHVISGKTSAEFSFTGINGVKL